MPNPPYPPNGFGLRLENELVQLRLAAQFGTSLTHSQPLPPAITAAWLREVGDAEQVFAGAQRISMAAYLGHPRFPAEHRLSEKGLQRELNRLKALLEERDIVVQTLHPVPPRELYRYLTEDLLWEVVEDVRIPGISQQFVYEGYCSNEAFEVEHTVIEFFDMLLGRYFAMLESIIYVPAGELADHPELVSRVDRLCDFADSFDHLELEELQLENLEFLADQTAEVRFQVRFLGYPNHGGEGILFAGPARFRMQQDRYHDWAIAELEIPGVFAPLEDQ